MLLNINERFEIICDELKKEDYIYIHEYFDRDNNNPINFKFNFRFAVDLYNSKNEYMDTVYVCCGTTDFEVDYMGIEALDDNSDFMIDYYYKTVGKCIRNAMKKMQDKNYSLLIDKALKED